VTLHDAYLENRVLSADPLELICLVYQHAIDMVHDARGHLADGNIPARSRSISRAIAAISELDLSLDHAAGGEISRNLAELYRYMRQRLTEANLHRQDAPLAEVISLLSTLAEAWDTSRKQALALEPAVPRDFIPAHSALAESASYGQQWGA
jgi:flagellar secretion chaperone FliS